ncbi:MAG: hypothetical protein Q8P21_01055 [bacterium]|nr:hypothetical protein [bacterium]
MRILLVDDSVRHRRAGIKQLEAAGHQVVALNSYGEAHRQVRQEQFDVALVDLLMPAEEMTLGEEGLKHLGSQIGVGYALALDLPYGNVGAVVVATDTNHHNHPLSAIVDWFHGRPLIVNGKAVRIIHAKLNEDGTKDWLSALESIGS